MFRKMLLVGVGCASVVLAGSANAAQLQLNYTTAASDTFSALLTLSATSTAGEYLVTGLTGTRDGLALTLLAPGTFPSDPSTIPNDNLVFTTSILLDFSGFSFVDSSGTDYNTYYGDFNNDGIDRYIECYSGATCAKESDISTISPIFSGIAAVPEPASWAMMLGGFGVIGGAIRARRRLRFSFN